MENNLIKNMLELLKENRKEFNGLPRSLGYDFTHIPKLEKVIKEAEEYVKAYGE